MVFSSLEIDFALKAGLGEGMVYGGAAPRLRRLIPINLDEGRGQFMNDLRKKEVA